MVGGKGRQKDCEYSQHWLDVLLLTSGQIQPGDIEVSSVASRVSNGEVWIIKGVVNYA